MSLIASYLDVIYTFVLGLFIIVSPSGVAPVIVPAPEAAPYSAPVVLVAPGAILPSASATTTPSLTTPPETTPLTTSAIALRKALVNIICYVNSSDSKLYSISASGVIVDPKGIILTNAHIAQYFLLTDHGVSCTIRAGGPATDAYKAALIYISPTWLEANTDVLTQANPSGTGEHDFAFLAVTASAPRTDSGQATSTPLPSSFSHVRLAAESPDIGTPVAVASYGAQFLKFSQIQSALYPIVVFGSVKDVFTFATTSIDIIALGGSAAAQEGSSGGGVVNESGELAGIITTSRVKGDFSTRALNAITTSYIRTEYASETGQSLGSLLAKPPLTAVADFAPQASVLGAALIAQLR